MYMYYRILFIQYAVLENDNLKIARSWTEIPEYSLESQIRPRGYKNFHAQLSIKFLMLLSIKIYRNSIFLDSDKS